MAPARLTIAAVAATAASLLFATFSTPHSRLTIAAVAATAAMLLFMIFSHLDRRLTIAAVAATAAKAAEKNVDLGSTASRLPQSRRLRPRATKSILRPNDRLTIAAVAATAA